MSDLYILDTPVLRDDLRSGCHRERIGALRGAVRMSAVVLAELWSGASSALDVHILEKLGRIASVLTPREQDWIDSGRLLATMAAEERLDPARVRELHFDVLIALTACSHGARLVTSDRADFELIRGYREFRLEVW
jgi:predicted nucleic acid-binding protein